MDARIIHDALLRYEQQSAEMYEFAQKWLRETRNPREKDRANSILRHAKGVIVHAGAGRHELST